MTTIITGTKSVRVVDGDITMISFDVDTDGDMIDLKLKDCEGATVICDVGINKNDVHAWVDDLVAKVKRLQKEIYENMPNPNKQPSKGKGK